MAQQQSESESESDGSVLVLGRQRFRAVDRVSLARFGHRMLCEIGQGHRRATITLVSDRRIRRLNRMYRSLDRPTDVLAFPNEPDFPHEETDLGDVVISTETATRNALSRRLTFERELRNLVIHGLLHLCGYDHETDQGEMKQLERRLRRRLIDPSL